MDVAQTSNFLKPICLLLLSLAICAFSYSYFLKINANIEYQNKIAEKHEYQLVQLGEMRRDQYLLDKKTGRNWISICTGKSNGPDCDGSIVWEERLIVGLNGYSEEDFMRYMQYLESLKQKKTKK